MKGILLLSHGELAKGMADSAMLFFGEEIPQLDYLCLREGESPDEFAEQMQKKAAELDTGDGVIILAELYGGTPCNQATLMLKDGQDLIAGMNFTMVTQLLSDRDSDEIDLAALLDISRDGILNIREKLAESVQEDDLF